jgi:transcriptional regulator of acetoin/glycerol metabolism
MITRQVGPVRFKIDPAALEVIVRSDWPGNVRALANVLERAQILAENHLITTDDLPEAIVENTAPASTPDADPRHLREVERRHVLEMLKQEKWNKVHAAKALGISRRALYRLIEKYKLQEN